MKENLAELMTTTNISKDENKLIMKYLMNRYDSMRVRAMMTEILDCNFTNITDEDANNLVGLLGGETQQETQREKEAEKLYQSMPNSPDNYMNETTNNEDIKYDQLKKENDALNSVNFVTKSENEHLREEIKKLREIADRLKDIDIGSIIEENKRLKKLVILTEKQILQVVEDDLINEWYVEHISGENLNKDAMVFDKNENKIFVKTYYKV